MIELGLFDWVIWVIYFTLFYLLFYIYKNSKADQELYRYFVPAFLIKVFGGVVFTLVYVYYYGFGDTFLYFEGSNVLADVITNDLGTYSRLMLSESGNLQADLAEYGALIPYSRTYEEWFMVKLLSPLNLLSYGSYLVLTLFLSVISFFGAWKLFKVFEDIFRLTENKRNKKYIKIAFACSFLIPSAIFWGGGILKDTITLAALNYLIYLFYFSIFKGDYSLFKFLLIALVSFLIIKLKAYILLSFIPGLMFGIYLKYKQSIRSRFIRSLAGPLLLIGLTAGSVFILNSFLAQEGKYNSQALEKRVKGFHSWHKDVGGSFYDLGEVDYSSSGVIKKIPASLNVTFFRPYLWEANNPVLFLGAIESLAFLILFLFTLVKSRLKMFSELKSQPLLYGMVLFCLIFGFAVGFTSYNFGALARYKIPLLSISVMILVYINVQSKVSNSNKNQPSHQSSDQD
jgi:hypothetical protein